MNFSPSQEKQRENPKIDINLWVFPHNLPIPSLITDRPVNTKLFMFSEILSKYSIADASTFTRFDYVRFKRLKLIPYNGMNKLLTHSVSLFY